MNSYSLSGAWEFRQAEANEWLPATVPGGVHTDLAAAGRIPNPFVGDNEKKVRWVAESNWEYRREFSVTPELLKEEHVLLICDGLDTLATLTLNGTLLGSTDNMYRQYRWEVKSLLKEKDNLLVIAFESPVTSVAKKLAERPLLGVEHAIPGGQYLRKAPCQYGWDWGPKLPPIGIWKDIRLEGYTHDRLHTVWLRQQAAADGSYTISAQVTAERWTLAQVKAILKVTAPDGKIFTHEELIPQITVDLAVTIDKPQLWWPNGYGEQPLYTVEVTLQLANKPGEKPLDQRSYKMGLRTIELRQQKDEWGRSFEFVVNGVRIFAKGSNWIPADSFPTRITDAYLEGLIRDAALSHQNMLRVWGGGFYEEERFYDYCDKYGILVWQEFVAACSMYPWDEPAFIENFHVEAVENIRRLRHRASLALWCGNNEIEWGWSDWSWNGEEAKKLKLAYDRFYNEILPSWVTAEDPDRPYWPSSPSSNDPAIHPNSQVQGDAHYWDVWHGRKPFTAYREVYPRFMSEFGFQALPPLDTIKVYADEADWNMTSYIMEQHQKNASGNQLMVSQMLDTFQLPKDFASLVYLSMVLQAEGIRFGVEHWRRHMDRVAGTLYWQLNDCWPVASWSSLDYFGRWKALHYAARRFYAPLMLSVEDKGTTAGVYVSSDLQQPWEGSVRWSLETLKGAVLISGTQAVKAAPLSATHITTLEFAKQVNESNRRSLVFVAELWQGNQHLATQVTSFAPTKHMTLLAPELSASLHVKGSQLTIELSTKTFARLVEISLEGASVVFSDNYFDLPAGRKVSITCPLPAGWTLAQAQAALKLQTVYDTYAHPSAE